MGRVVLLAEVLEESEFSALPLSGASCMWLVAALLQPLIILSALTLTVPFLLPVMRTPVIKPIQTVQDNFTITVYLT